MSPTWSVTASPATVSKAHVFSATEDRSAAMAFAGRGLDDRHHFRFVVAPEDAAEMNDLKASARSIASCFAPSFRTRKARRRANRREMRKVKHCPAGGANDQGFGKAGERIAQ
jgi:hypothetical protein